MFSESPPLSGDKPPPKTKWFGRALSAEVQCQAVCGGRIRIIEVEFRQISRFDRNNSDELDLETTQHGNVNKDLQIM
ncbi:MAG: hypothetical protein ACLGHS_01425 [Actinomycetes bacterium]